MSANDNDTSYNSIFNANADTEEALKKARELGRIGGNPLTLPGGFDSLIEYNIGQADRELEKFLTGRAPNF